MQFKDIVYERPDVGKFRGYKEEYIRKLQNAESYISARALFLENDERDCEFNTMYNVAYIRNTMDTSDKFYEAEMNFFYEESPKLQLLARRESEILLASPYKSDFEREFGADLIKGMEAAVRLADESVVEEQVEEAKLGQEYSKTVASCSVNFMGEDCNFYGLLKHMQATDRAERKAAYLAWADMYSGVADKLDGIYLRLVEIRKKIADKLGFENYVQCAYLQNGHYYYGADDVAAFRKQVIDVIVPAVSRLYEKQAERLGVGKLKYYDEQLFYPEGNAVPDGDMNCLVRGAREMYAELSPQTKEFFDFMCENGLFDLETRKNKHMGGYCTFLYKYKAPFIFSNFNGTSADVDVLTHEAGHAFQAYCTAKRVKLGGQIWSTNEISEIHSMTMEHFAYPYMEKFFGEKADKYRYSHLAQALQTVPYLCLVDHFQHEVFANNFDAAGLRKCWRKLEKLYMPWRDYDNNAFLEGGGFWMQKQHIFLHPFYYVDYALAQMGAFEYYSRAKTDGKQAWNDYFELCKAGGSKSYFELLKLGNLSNPFESGSVEKAAGAVIKELLAK